MAPRKSLIPATHPHVRPDLVRHALEHEIGPERRPDEPHAVDPHPARVEEVDPDFRALVRQPLPRLLDLGPVELVVPEHVEDVRRARPAPRDELDEPFGVGREVACEDDDVRLRVMLGQVAAVLEAQVGEDLDLHRSFDVRSENIPAPPRGAGSSSRTHCDCDCPDAGQRRRVHGRPEVRVPENPDPRPPLSESGALMTSV